MAQDEPLVVGSSTKIMKGVLNFKAKSWWTLVRHRLSPTMTNNVLSPDRATLVTGIMEGYEIDIAKILMRDI